MLVKPRLKHLFLFSHPEQVFCCVQDKLWLDHERWFLKENINIPPGDELAILRKVAGRHNIPIETDSLQELEPFWLDRRFRFKSYKFKVIPMIVKVGKCTLRGLGVVEPLTESEHLNRLNQKQIDQYRQSQVP